MLESKLNAGRYSVLWSRVPQWNNVRKVMSRGVPECELVVCTEEDCGSGGGLE